MLSAQITAVARSHPATGQSVNVSAAQLGAGGPARDRARIVEPARLCHLGGQSARQGEHWRIASDKWVPRGAKERDGPTSDLCLAL